MQLRNNVRVWLPKVEFQLSSRQTGRLQAGRSKAVAQQYRNWACVRACKHLNVLERCNRWPRVSIRHVCISQLLSLWRHSYYDVSRLRRSQPPFSLWRHSHCDVIRYWAGHAQGKGALLPLESVGVGLRSFRWPLLFTVLNSSSLLTHGHSLVVWCLCTLLVVPLRLSVCMC